MNTIELFFCYRIKGIDFVYKIQTHDKMLLF